MIPHLLKIKGLYSYREMVEIDFDRLSSEGLFGIFGAVGSGKSAILEAMTFALFGNTERMNSRENRGYNMMNLQSQELIIEFEFSLDKGSNDRYRFALRQTRNSKQFEKISSPQRSAYQLVAGNWVPLENTDATEVLGLSYDNFTKTIIIPQGRFQAFLHMGQKDRTEMFKEMFLLNQFDLWEPTRRLGSETRDQLLRLDEQLKSMEEASQEELEALQLRIAVLTQAMEQGKEQEKLLLQAVQRHQQLQKTALEIEKCKAALADLEARKPEMAQREARLKQFSMVRLEFGSLLENLARLEQQIQRQAEEFKQVQQTQREHEGQLSAAKVRFEAAQSAIAEKPRMETELQDCKHWLVIKAAEVAVAELAQRLQNGAAKLKAKQDELATLEAAHLAASSKLSQLKSAMPDLHRLGDARGWFQQKAQLDKEKQTLLASKAQSLSALKQTAEELEKLRAELGLQQELESSGASENIRQTRLAELDQLRAAKEKLAQQLGLAAFALHLHDGEPCPLCGSEAHPQPYDSAEAEEKLKTAELGLQKAEQAWRILEEGLLRIQRLSDQQAMRSEQDGQISSDLEDIEARIAAHLALFVWQEFEPEKPEVLAAALEAARQLEQQIKALEEEGRKQEEALKLVRAELERYQKGIQDLTEDRVRREGELEGRKQQLSLLKYAEHAQQTLPSWEAREQELQQQIERLQTNLEESQQAEKVLEMRAVQLKERLAALHAAQSQSLAEQNNLQAQMTTKLKSKGFAQVGELQQILALSIDVDREEAELKAHRDAVLSGQASLQTLQQAMGGAAYDQAAHQESEIAASNLQQQLEQSQAELTLGQSRLQQMEKQLALKAQLFEQQAELQKRQDNLRVLESLFKGAGFVQYVSTIYLKELVARADERFRRLTRNMLKLELDDDAEFQVRDMLNGGQLRSVKTLSGGQTFQASLCLALALADNMAARSGSRQNFFFLDEGFGTLDRESLSAVFDTLKELRNEHRVVGVISHVEELQQEIETHLKVQQSEARGSWVTGSWE